MKPNFALDFRSEQITLLHMQDGQWVQIGNVSIEDPDLDSAMGYMRATALGLSPRGIACKLILPDEAILYTSLRDLSADPARRAAQIATALVGRTPYDVADLVYDWTDDGDSAHMAVIARETLDEAESFATQHRFAAVAFVAWPPQGRFDGEAWFGQTAVAETLLAQGEYVERDTLAEPSPQDTAQDFEMGAAPADDITEDDHGAYDIAETGLIPDAEPQARVDDVTPPDVQDHGAAGIKAVASEPPAPQQQDLFAPAPAAPPQVDAPVDAPPQDEAPMALDVPPYDEADADQAAPEQDAPEQAAPELAAPQQIGQIAADQKPAQDSKPIPVFAPQTADAASKAETLLAAFTARRAAAMAEQERIEPILRVSPEKPASSAMPRPTLTAPPRSPIAPLPKTAAPNGLGSTPKKVAPRAAGSGSVVMGFVLTILLLIALAAAAAMFTYTTGAWNSYQDSLIQSAALDNSGDDIAPSIADEMAADLPEDDIMVRDSTALAAPQDVATSDPALAALTQDVAAPTPMAPTLPDPTSPNAATPVLTLATSNALPPPQVSPAPLTAPAVIAQAPIIAPMITPTADGVMTPEGVFLIAGRPKLVPPARSGVVAALGSDPALAGKKPLLRPDTLVAQIVNDPALADKRPLPRPASVLDASLAAKALDGDALDGPRSALAVTISRIPVTRSRDVPTPNETIAQDSTTDPATVDPATVETAVEADGEPEVVAMKSSGPRTVVSQNATFKNAINLSKVNLIGVYGSQANRYALVRQASGRFKKFYIGDRFDGGVVAAITDSELRYSKDGQMVALKMPKG